MALKSLKDSKLLKSIKNFYKVLANGFASTFKKACDAIIPIALKTHNLTSMYLYNISYFVGKRALGVIILCKKACMPYITKIWNLTNPIRVSIAVKTNTILSKVIHSIVFPFSTVKNKWQNAIKRVKAAKEKGLLALVKESFLLCKDFAVLLFKILCGCMSYAAPIAAVIALVTVVNSYSQLVNYAVAVEYDGQVLGYILEDSVYEEAQIILQSRLVGQEDKEILNQQPNYSLAVVSEEDVIDASELSDKIIEVSGSVISEATGVYIDGELIGAVEDLDQIQADLDAMLNQYRTDAEGEQVEFVQDVSLQTGLYPVESILETSIVLELIHSEKSGLKTYTAESGDAPLSIAGAFDMTLSDLVALNPTIEDKLLIGDAVVISNSVPFLSVKVTRSETYLEDIAYGTQTTSDRQYYVGYTKVTTAGVNGKQEVNANITYVDGVSVSTDVLSTTVITEPVDQVVLQGSLPVTGYSTSRGSSAIAASVSSGTFSWPVGGDGGYISCRWWGYYGHNGMDVAGKYGTNILASDAGVVIKAGWDYTGFGKVVIIDHGNGVKTLYGHNSSLYVTVGQTVSKGQVIAAMGSTGNSTGNHCHFSVIINGVYKNPALYIG